MSYILQDFLIVSLCLFLAFGTICPSEKLSITSFPILTGDDFAHSSKSFDAVYQIKQNKTENYNLFGHRISEVENEANAYFDVKEFFIESSSTEKIVFVSDYGNCVIVETRPSLKVYQTSQNQFILSQMISADGYSSAQVNDNCSVLRIVMGDGTQKVYKNSQISILIIFPIQSKFDSFYNYGIDNSKKLRKASGTGIDSISLGDSTLEDIPVLIENKKNLNSLTIVTKDSKTLQYTLAVVNTLTDKLVYFKSWPSSSYSVELLVEISELGNFAFIRDQKGFLILLEIIFSSTSDLAVKEIALESSDYISLFSKDAVVSFTQNAIISYQNKAMNYFQSLESTLYFLTSLPADLETEAFKFSGLSSQSTTLIPTFIEPSLYEDSYISSSGKQQSSVRDLIQDGEIPVSRNSNGQVVKCPSECITCKQNGACLICSLGYSLSSTGKCVFCSGCRTCFPESPQTCLSCFLPYVFNPTTSKCQSSKCTESFCISCHLNGTCKQCFSGYSVHNEQCVKCQDGCEQCLLKGADTCDTQISFCKLGFVFSSHKSKGSNFSCVECATGCLSCSCNPTKTCTACADGYALQSGECFKCTYTDFNCQGCSTSALSVCSKCKLGSYMNPDRQCIKCQAERTGCQENDACFSCSAGFYLAKTDESVTGKCLSCIQQCKKCNKFGYLCTSCQKGYVLEGSKCISEDHLGYTITVDSPLQMVILVSRTFVSLLISLTQKYSVDSTKPLKLNSNDLTISKLKSGSSIISGLISTFSEAQSNAIASKITEELPGTALQEGYSIIAVTANIVIPVITNESQPSTSIGLILGVVIPLGLLLLVSFFVILRVLYKRKQDDKQSSFDTNQEHFFDESQKGIVHSYDGSQKI